MLFLFTVCDMSCDNVLLWHFYLHFTHRHLLYFHAYIMWLHVFNYFLERLWTVSLCPVFKCELVRVCALLRTCVRSCPSVCVSVVFYYLTYIRILFIFAKYELRKSLKQHPTRVDFFHVLGIDKILSLADCVIMFIQYMILSRFLNMDCASFQMYDWQNIKLHVVCLKMIKASNDCFVYS